jgi:ribosomal protein S19E (S16A)
VICDGYYCLISYFQTVVTQINHAIGASGIVSQECKTVVTQYGKTILDMIVAEVDILLFSISYETLLHITILPF